MGKDKGKGKEGTGSQPAVADARLRARELGKPFASHKKTSEGIITHLPDYHTYHKRWIPAMKPLLNSCGYSEYFSVIPDGDKVIAKPVLPALRFAHGDMPGENTIAIGTLDAVHRLALAGNIARELAALHEKGYELSRFTLADVTTLVQANSTRTVFTNFDRFKRSADRLGNLSYVLAVLLATRVIDGGSLKTVIGHYLRASKAYALEEYDSLAGQVASKAVRFSQVYGSFQNKPLKRL